MDEYLSLLAACAVFQGLQEQEIREALKALSPRVRDYPKDAVLLLSGDAATALGIVLCGAITATKLTPAGTQLTIAHMEAGGIFGDVLSAGAQKSPVTVTAGTPCRVLWLRFELVLEGGGLHRAVHTQLLRNVIRLMSDKYFALDRRVEVLLLRGVREKLLYYLHNEAQRLPNGAYQTPLSRAQLAAYLGCERTALCRELSRMQRDGVLRVEKRSFWILR